LFVVRCLSLYTSAAVPAQRARSIREATEKDKIMQQEFGSTWASQLEALEMHWVVSPAAQKLNSNLSSEQP